jgi:hypothetical protein
VIGAALVALTLVAAPGAAGAAADPPAWVRAAAAAPTAGGPATVLLDDADVTITADGRMRTSRRYAVRITDRSAREAAVLREVYLTGSGRIRDLRAWVVRPGGTTRSLGGRDVVDAALVNNDVYNEVRVRLLGAADEVMPGDVFAAEVASEDRLLFAQFEWPLQERWHVQHARRALTLPAGWRAEAITFNGQTPDPRRDGQTTIWEFRDLPELADEPAMPPFAGRAPRLAVSVFAAAGAQAPGQFESWQQVAAWLDALSQDTGATAASIAARARELTAGAASPLERVTAIGRFAQRIQYVSIQTGLGRGGGYQPRPAALVLERNYGDCKDKASLMRALLAALGIKSHLVSLYAGDRHYVRPQWPSPQQFNHAIIAVSLPEMPAGVTSAIDHPALGPLLLFDPTDEQTPVGELPLHEQGSLALIVSDQAGDLVRLPATPAGLHRRLRTVEGEITGAGGLAAAIREELSGTLAAQARGLQATADAGAYARTVATRVTRAVPRAQVAELTVTAGQGTPATVVVQYRLSAADFAQPQGALVLLRLPLEVSDRLHLPGGEARRTAVELEPRSASETIDLALPEGWAVDELPEPVALDASVGRYRRSVTHAGGRLVVTRSLEVPLQTIEPARYAEARTFFDAIRAADAAVVVLRR